MKELQRSLRNFFHRELDRLDRLMSLARRSLRPRRRPGRPGGRDGGGGAGRAGAGAREAGGSAWRRRHPRSDEAAATPPRAPPDRRLIRRRRHPILAGAASLALHAALLWVLYRASLGIPGASSEPEEHAVTIRLVVPAPVPRKASPPAPEPLPKPPLERPPPERERGAPEPEATPRPDPIPRDEPARGREDALAAVEDVPLSVRRAAAPDVPLPLGVGARREASAKGTATGAGLGHRGLGKEDALRRHGGSANTEGAVAMGLRWLAAHQDADGGWSAEGFQRHCRAHVPCAGRGLPEFDVGVTALATLAFLGAGHIPGEDDAPGPEGVRVPSGAPAARAYGPTLARALGFLLSRQGSDGTFGRIGNHYVYNHALATFAVAEALAATGSAAYRRSVEAAVAAAGSMQQPGGGWDYIGETTGRNDLSVTGWQVMALKLAGDAGVAVPKETLDRVARYLLDAVTGSGEGIYTNQGQEAGRRGINMVSVGLLSKLYLGDSPTSAPVRGAVRRLIQTPPSRKALDRWEITFQSYYYWYTATLALFHLGGEEWRAWNVFLLRELLDLQSHRPHEEGSWPPEMSWIGVSGGRVYSTAINVLTLETYYRYEPLHADRKP